MIISNSTELLEFIKREDVTLKQAMEVVQKTLTVILFDNNETKEQFLVKAEEFIKEFGHLPLTERPLFIL